MFEVKMYVWKKNGFLTGKGEPIRNRHEWLELEKELERHLVEVKKVSSHQYSNWLLSEMKKYVDNS